VEYENRLSVDFGKSEIWERGCGCRCVPKKFEIFFIIKIKYGLYVLDHFNMLMSKIIFKK
jgi:hypothetical protein